MGICNFIFLNGFIFSLFFYSCNDNPSITLSGLRSNDFHVTVDGKSTDLYTLRNKRGMEVCITNYGCRVVSIVLPDKQRKNVDVVLGYDSIGEYISDKMGLGALSGRFVGRIKNGRLNIGGEFFQLKRDMHEVDFVEGNSGFQSKVFNAKQLSKSKIVFTYISPNAEEGFPGNLMCSVTFKLTDENGLDIQYEAETDRSTVVNMAHQIYFNLNRQRFTSSTDEFLSIDANYYLPIDKHMNLMGKKAKVEDSPAMNFKKMHKIADYINDGRCLQINNGHGYDHCYVLNVARNMSKPSVQLYSAETGINLKIYSSDPVVKFYSGNMLDGRIRGKHGAFYNQRSGVVLSAQKLPYLYPFFRKSILKPGQKYTSHVTLKFSVVK